MNDNALQLHLEIKNRLETVLKKRNAALFEAVSAIVAEAQAEWEAKGGCKTCSGTKSVLTWSTMDSAGYDEHGPCKDCNNNSDAVGMSPLVCGPARSNRTDELYPDDVAAKLQPTTINFLREEVGEIAGPLKVIGLKRKLDYVIVVKGRKVPVGTHGVLVAYKESQWGVKVCIIDGEGVKHWTDTNNVQGLLTENKSIKIAAIEQYIKSDNEFRKSKGAPTSPHTVESLLK